MSMDMGHMHGSGMGFDINYAFARDYWYIVAGVVGMLAAVRAINAYGAAQRCVIEECMECILSTDGP